jgi:hypothetical protein
MKHFLSVLLAAMAIIAGVAGNVSKCDHWGAAVFFWSICGILGVLAVIVGFIESTPKPHLVPVGYGKVDGNIDGLVFVNDGEPAYCVSPPKPTPLGGMGDATLLFDDPTITRLSKNGGMQLFPITVKDSLGAKINDLRTEMILRGVDSVLVSFQYADGKRPTALRYTTICRIQPHTKGVAISLEKYSFAWWAIFRR